MIMLLIVHILKHFVNEINVALTLFANLHVIGGPPLFESQRAPTGLVSPYPGPLLKALPP